MTVRMPSVVGLADRLDAEEQPLAGLELDLVLLALLEAVEELDGAEDREVAVGLARGLELAPSGRGRAAG